MPIPQTHTPRGYKKTEIPLEAKDIGSLITVLTCEGCGALVLYYATHDKWHAAIQKSFLNTRSRR